MKPSSLFKAASFILILASVSNAHAGIVSWTDWASANSSTSQVSGNLTVGASTVNVTATGAYDFAQINGIGTNYWSPSAPYISANVSNAPPNPDIIALGTGGTETITFSQPILNPLIALVSWNGNTVDFGVPIQILSFGAGFWGNGTPLLNAAGTGFFGSGEVHGVVELPGTYTSISFTHTTEFWHGFTVGVEGLGGGTSNNIPEPASLSLLVIGFAVFSAIRRSKKT